MRPWTMNSETTHSRQSAAPSLDRAMSECAGGEIWLEKVQLPPAEEDASEEESEASDEE